MKTKLLLCLALITGFFGFAKAAEVPVCITNDFGEQASLVFKATGGGMYAVSGTQNYTPFGSTEWPVTGTFNKKTGALHYVATNPNPDNCTMFANTVTFDYTATSRSRLTGSFSNDCGVAGGLGASAAKGDCGYFAPPSKPGEYGATGAHKMNRSKLPLPAGESLLSILGVSVANAAAAGIPVCLTNDFGEQASLILTATGGGMYAVSGTQNYTPFGSTEWPVTGTFNKKTGALHYVATNPNPDNCTMFANTVTFDYTATSRSRLTGSFSNDCGVAGGLGASAAKGDCGYFAPPSKPGEYGATGAHKMNRSKLPLPAGESLLSILGVSADNAAAAGIPVCLTNDFGEQASLILTATGGGMYAVSGTQNYTPFGSTEWPVTGTFNKKTGALHYVATNPNPDNCTMFANTVTFDYTATSRSRLTGSFSNDCGVAGGLGASAAKGDCGYFAPPSKPGEYGATGAHKMNRSKLPLPAGESLLSILGVSVANAAAAGIPVCLTNDFGEQASLILTATGGGMYAVSGTQNYTPFGSTEWPVTGTFNKKTGALHYVATNPNPDNCTMFANTVTFDYTATSRSRLTGSFSNDCGVAGGLGASAAKGDCGYFAPPSKPGEYGATGAHKMNRSKLPLPAGESLLSILGVSVANAAAAGIPVCLTNDFGEQASLILTATGGGMYAVSGTQNYTPFGSTEWPVSGTFNKKTGALHYVATNPNPDNCTMFANTVTFDYTATSRSRLTGSFSNDCGVAGGLGASAAKGDCGYFAPPSKPGEYGATGAHKMNRSKLPLPAGESLLKILGGISMDISPNPVLHSTKIEIKMDFAANVRVQIYDQFGNLARTIVNGNLSQGVHQYSWNRMTDRGSRAPQGYYFVKVISEAGEVSQQILVMN